jgi:hypothetical protein
LRSDKRRFSGPDRQATLLTAAICKEVKFPFAAPICSSVSSQFYWTMPDMDVVFVPCLEPEHLLGLPDIYHELGHILLFREKGRLVQAGLAIVDRCYDDLVAEGKKQNWPAASLDEVERFRDGWRQAWLLEFGSDLIAAYLVGPAFGWCNIRTSTNLGGELFSGSESHPADDARAKAVAVMLERIGCRDAAAEIQSRWDELVGLSKESAPHRYDLAYPAVLLSDLAKFFDSECQALGLERYASSATDVSPVAAAVNEAWREFRQRPEQFDGFERQRLAALLQTIGDCNTGRCPAVGLGNSFFDKRLVLRKRQHVDAVAPRLLVNQHQGRAVMLDDRSQAAADGGKKVVQAQMGDHRIVHFQQKPHAVAFVHQLPLGGLGALVVQHVVHGDGDLLRHLVHEVDLCWLIGPPVLAPESHGAQPPQRRGQRNHAERLHAVLAQQGLQLRETALERYILDHQGLLSFPHQAPWRFVDGQLQPRADRAGLRHHEQVQAHHVARGIVQHQVDVIERDDGREPLGEIVEQLAQVPVHRNGFPNLQQGPVLLAGEESLPVFQQFRHDKMLRRATLII